MSAASIASVSKLQWVSSSILGLLLVAFACLSPDLLVLSAEPFLNALRLVSGLIFLASAD